MINRVAGLIPAAVLVLLLAGCGGEESGGTAEEGSTSESPSATASETPSEPASSEPAASEATGQDYLDLLLVVFEQEGQMEGVETPEQFNEQADLPEGVAMVELDQNGENLCLEDSPQDIAIRFSSKGVVMYDGPCDGEEVASVVPQGQNDLKTTGEQELAEPTAQYFREEFGAGS